MKVHWVAQVNLPMNSILGVMAMQRELQPMEFKHVVSSQREETLCSIESIT